MADTHKVPMQDTGQGIPNDHPFVALKLRSKSGFTSSVGSKFVTGGLNFDTDDTIGTIAKRKGNVALGGIQNLRKKM